MYVALAAQLQKNGMTMLLNPYNRRESGPCFAMLWIRLMASRSIGWVMVIMGSGSSGRAFSLSTEWPRLRMRATMDVHHFFFLGSPL